MNPDITITTAGDLMLGEMPLNIRIGLASEIKKDNSIKRYFSDDILSILKSDINFCNLEAVITDRDRKEKPNNLVFTAPLSAIELIKKSGFNILNVANNHVLEHGKSKFINMLESLKERGISVIGSCKNPFIIIRVGGIKLGFIGISQVQDPNYVKNTYINDINTAYRLIKTNKEKVDHIIVSVHWGQEYTLKPTQEQRELGHRLIDAGARILIGHHPHTVHKVEEYNNGLIIYSLGNFISDMSFPITRYGKVVKIKLNKFKISDFETFYTYQDQKYRVILLDNKPKPLETEVNPKDLSQEYRLYLKKEFAQKFLSRPLGVNLYLIKNYIIKR